MSDSTPGGLDESKMVEPAWAPGDGSHAGAAFRMKLADGRVLVVFNTMVPHRMQWGWTIDLPPKRGKFGDLTSDSPNQVYGSDYYATDAEAKAAVELVAGLTRERELLALLPTLRRAFIDGVLWVTPERAREGAELMAEREAEQRYPGTTPAIRPDRQD